MWTALHLYHDNMTRGHRHVLSTDMSTQMAVQPESRHLSCSAADEQQRWTRAEAKCGGHVIIPPKHIAPLSSSAIMDGGWLPLRPSLCTAEHCEPHEIKLLLKRRITLLGSTLFPSPFPLSLISYSYWSHLHSPLGMGFKMSESRNECWINRFKH